MAKCSNCRMSERGHRNATQHTNATHAPRRLTCRSWKYFKDGRDLYPTALALHGRVQTSLPMVRWPVGAVSESPTQSATLVELALHVYSSERHVRTLCSIQTGKGTWQTDRVTCSLYQIWSPHINHTWTLSKSHQAGVPCLRWCSSQSDSRYNWQLKTRNTTMHCIVLLIQPCITGWTLSAVMKWDWSSTIIYKLCYVPFFSNLASKAMHLMMTASPQTITYIRMYYDQISSFI